MIARAATTWSGQRVLRAHRALVSGLWEAAAIVPGPGHAPSTDGIRPDRETIDGGLQPPFPSSARDVQQLLTDFRWGGKHRHAPAVRLPPCNCGPMFRSSTVQCIFLCVLPRYTRSNLRHAPATLMPSARPASRLSVPASTTPPPPIPFHPQSTITVQYCSDASGDDKHIAVPPEGPAFDVYCSQSSSSVNAQIGTAFFGHRKCMLLVGLSHSAPRLPMQ